MAKKYKQLSLEERETIQVRVWEGASLRNIARSLQRDVSTLSRELKRNRTPEMHRYTSRVAHEKARVRIMSRGQRLRLKSSLIRTYTHTKLQEGYSPEQIAGCLPSMHPGSSISPEAIYQYIYAQYHRGGYGVCTGKDLRKYLRRRHSVRHPKRIPYAVEKAPISHRISIEKRPAIVERRKQPGHWEGDSIVSQKSPVRLNTLVERTSGLVLISRLEDRTSRETTKIVIRRLRRIPRNIRRTITLDNGSENAGHETITACLKMPIYFAHPYHSWERGTNENTNGLIRWYVPKGTDLATLSEERIREIEYRLNTRPRKRLNWKTPLEVFNSLVLH